MKFALLKNDFKCFATESIIKQDSLPYLRKNLKSCKLLLLNSSVLSACILNNKQRKGTYLITVFKPWNNN